MTKEKRSIHVERRVRPIRFVFLVNVNDKKQLKKVMELNACLWGGKYNGIIPIFKRIPKWWDNRNEYNTAQKIVQGYIEAFEPDYIVAMNQELKKGVKFDKERILNFEDVLTKEENYSYHIKVGLNLNEVMVTNYEKEYRFQQRHPQKAFLTKGLDNELICMAAFGRFPNSHKYFTSNYKTVYSAKVIKITPKNYFSYLTKPFITPIKVGNWRLNKTKRPMNWGPILFLMDDKKPIDIIDFWNLRAVGSNVLPIPNEWTADMADELHEFVKKNNVPMPGNKNGVMLETRVLKSRSISGEDLKSFVTAIQKDKPRSLVQQTWFPRMWDTWARSKDNVERCHVSHIEKDIECNVEDRHISFPSISPELDDSRSVLSPRWVNVVNFRDYSRTGDLALVYPKEINNLESLLRTSFDRTVFPSSEGIVSVIKYESIDHRWSIPSGYQAFKTWLQDEGFSVEISHAGETAQQLIKALGGFWGVRHISNIEIIKLLDRMAHGLVETIPSKDSKPDKPIARSRMASRDTWWQLLLDIHEKRTKAANWHLETFVEKGILRLGVKIECTECKQANWYSLPDIGDKLKCEKCLEMFLFPSVHPPKQAWFYRTQGAFSVENYAHGSYSVALGLKFLSETMEAKNTWSPSIKIKGPNKLELECDFAMWRNELRFGEHKMSLIFGECKSFDEFKIEDINRMKKFAEKFPGSILAFCSLKESMTKKEIARLVKLAKWGRKSLGAGKTRAPVLILTKVELTHDQRPPYCWKEAGGRFADFAKNKHMGSIFELCDLTQQLHLGMDSYGSWKSASWKKAELRIRSKARKNEVVKVEN